MNKITINNLTLAYVRRGKGMPLVLLHGYPLDHHIWDDVVPLLEDKFDLIVPDLRGFGESTTIDSQYPMDDIASDIAGLLDHLRIQKAALAGHSMGGYVSLAFARLFFDRVRGLGLVSSQVLADPLDRKQGRYDTAKQVAEKGVGIVKDAMTPKLSADPRVQAFVAELIMKQSQGGIIGALKAMAERSDSTPLLSSFKFPLVIVHGEADALIPVDRAREIKAAVPGAHLIELRGGGHMPMMESPKETAEALKHLVL